MMNRRRGAITEIDEAELPTICRRNTAESSSTSKITSTGEAVLPSNQGNVSSPSANGRAPVRRNLFGTPAANSTFFSSSVNASETTPRSSATNFGATSSPLVGLGGNGTATGTSSKVAISAKIAAFRGGTMNAPLTPKQPTSFAMPSVLPSTTASASTSFLTATNQNLVQSASRPSFLSMGASTISTTGTSLFGSSASKPTTSGLFGSSTGTTIGGFGVTQKQQSQPLQQTVIQQQELLQSYHPFVKACGDPKLFGNDSDGVCAMLSQVTAALGVGKGLYKDANQIQTFNMEGNMFQKFVGIGYNRMSERTDDEGFVTLVLRHPMVNLNTEERRDKILEIIKSILANGTNVEVRYAPGTLMRPLSDGTTEICIIAKEGGFVASAIKLAQVLNDPPKMAQLESQLQVDKTRVLPQVGMSKAQRDRYLETTPFGIDERVWKQAIKENPAPNKLLPVPVRGWEALRDRQKAQIGESKLFHEAIQSLANRVDEANRQHANAVVNMEIIRNRHKALSYRIVRVLLAQWIVARYSRQIDTDEDILEAKSDTLLAQLNRHDQVKHYVDKFYEILETKPEKLQESMWNMFDMTIEDQHYARKVLSLFVNICCELYEKAHQHIESVESIRQVLEC